MMNDEIELIKKRLYLFENFYRILDHWLFLKERNISPTNYFINNNFYNIAIYGMGAMAIHLIKECELNNLTVKYGIDIEHADYYTNVPIYGIYDKWPKADVIVITEKSEKNIFKDLLKNQQLDIDIVTLDEVVFSII